jgi:hypothetical protein
MVLHPAAEVGHAGDERDCALAGLPVGDDLQAVLVLGDVTNCEVSDLTRACPGVSGDRDQRGVAAVERRVDHRKYVVLPVEHLGRVRLRIVGARRAGGNPVDTLGRLGPVGDSLCKDAERDAVVLVCLRVIVISVDPSEDVLGGVAVGQGIGEAADLLGDDRAVPEEFLLALGRVLGIQQGEPLVEVLEGLPVVVGQVAGFLDSVAQPVERGLWAVVMARLLRVYYLGGM